MDDDASSSDLPLSLLAPPVTEPMPVVGLQFCESHPMELIVVKKALSMTDGDYTVNDVNGTVMFKVQGIFFSFRDLRVLVDADGTPIVSMQQKIRSAHRRWKVFRGKSTDDKDTIFSVKKSSVLQFKTQLGVFLASNTSEDACDYSIKGSFFERSCKIYLGDTETIVAEMRKRHNAGSIFLGRDTFAVTVYANIDYAFITALIVVLDEINNDKGGDD